MRSNNRLVSIKKRCKEKRDNDTATHANYLVQSLPNGRACEVAALGKLETNTVVSMNRTRIFTHA